MGNPFITYSNRPSVGKIGASILETLGVEWIATSEKSMSKSRCSSRIQNYPPFVRT